MSNITRADLDEMRMSASRIAGIAEEFKDEYSAMYRVIHDELTNSWVGADSESFVNNVDSVRHKFEEMYEMILSYERAIIHAVEEYERQIREMEEAARRMQF